MMMNFKNEINNFYLLIQTLPDDIEDIWTVLDSGEPREFKKFNGIYTYDIVLLPEVGSAQYRFRELMWAGTWESLVDIDAGKAKKLKFLNEIKNIKQRYLAALKFMDVHGPRSSYWSKGECPEDSYIV